MSAPKINFDKLQQSHWTDDDKNKAAKVIEFVQLLMNEHDFEQVKQRFGSGRYKQHNRIIGDGIDGVIKTLTDLVKANPEYSYDVKRIFVDGDYVTIHSHATLKAKHRGDDTQGFNIMDTWQLENDNLVEHWDSIQGLNFAMRAYALVAGGAVRNSNGVF